jgi:tetratricopeptide (TPR) repeat protein
LIGNAFKKLECYTESIENYENAIKLEPQKADFYYAKGWAYTSLKQYQNAIFCYDKAINLGLKDYNVFYEKSLALYLLNDNQQALELIDKAIVINQNGYEAYNLRGNIKLNLLLDINDIIKDYTQAIQLNSFYSPAYFSRGTAYILLCDYKAALQDINYSESLDSELTKSACFNRGRIYRELGDFDSAITEFSKSIRIEENSLHYYNRALCYFDINNYEKAIQDYSFTIQFLPKSTNFLIPTDHIYFQRGLAYENLNNIDNAISDYHQAIILDSNCTEARCCLEKINSYYVSTKDFINEILGIYKQKIKIDKDNRETRITSIKDICTKQEINYLFHFTHKSNFASILNKGLLSRETLDIYEYNYKFNDPKRLDNCRNAICLSVGFPQYKMLLTLTGFKNQSDWIILLLNPSILWMLDCAFCYDNAASSSVTSIPIEKRKEADQLNKIFDPKCREENLPSYYPTNPQAEVLVFDPIPTTFIEKIHFKDINLYNQSINDFPEYRMLMERSTQYFNGRVDWERWKNYG